MIAKAGLITVVAVLLVALWHGGLSAVSVHAEENCLTAPNAPPPQGSRWYYHLDRSNQNKCWYVRKEGQSVQKPTVKESLEAGAVLKVSAAATPKNPRDTAPEVQQPVRVAPGAPAGRLTQGSTQDGVQASRQLAASTLPWPDPPSPATAEKVVWPDPPSPAGGVIRAENTLEGKSIVNSNEDRASDAKEVKQFASANEVRDSLAEMPASMLLALAVGLAISGLLVRWIAKMKFARQRTINRRKPEWTDSFESEPGTPEIEAHPSDFESGRVDTSLVDDEVVDHSPGDDKIKKTRRILAQALCQQAA